MSHASNSLIMKVPLISRLCYIHKGLKGALFYIIICTSSRDCL